MTSENEQTPSRRKMSSGSVARVLTMLGSRLALVGLSCLVALVALELMVRLVGMGSDQMLRQDSRLGLRFISDKEGLSQDHCYRANVSTNTHGWRSPEVSFEKADDVYRILVLGDSFIAAVQVEDDQTFSSKLMLALNSAGLGQKVEVINFGVPSFGTDQEYLALKHFGAAYDPDLVVLALYAQNDIKNNYEVIQQRDSVYPKPFFDVEDGELIELPYRDPTPWMISAVRRVVRPLRLYPLLRDRLMAFPATHRVLYALGIVGVVPETPGEQDQTSGSGKYPSRWESQRTVFLREYDAEWRHAWDITFALIKGIRNETRKIGSAFLVLGLSDPLAVLPLSELAKELPAAMIDEMDTDKSTRLTEDFSAREDIDFLSLIPGFRAKIGDSSERFDHHYLTCDGHWTVQGNQLAADITAAYLAPKIKAEIPR